MKEYGRIYQSFSDPYKRIRIAYIEAARKRPEDLERRLNNFICKSEREQNNNRDLAGLKNYY